MDPDQTAPMFAKMLLKHFSRREKQTTCVVVGSLKVNILPASATVIC